MPRYEGPIADVDVHHIWKRPAEVLAYMPEKWRLHAEARRSLVPRSVSPGVAPNGGRLIDSYEPGGTRGTDYDILSRSLLDPHRYYKAVLTHDVGHYGSHLNPYFSAAFASAANDWTIEQWLTRDERFVAVMIVPLGDPKAAAEEIARVGDHPQIVSVCMAGNVLGRAFGDPVYDPMYAAAEEHGLHLSLHLGPADQPGCGTTLVGGPPPPGIMRNSQTTQQAMHYISSFLVHGTFEKFPRLKVLVKEYGVAWLPWVMTRLDENYELMKLESPWVKRLPTEYIRDHIKLSTQPLEIGPGQKGVIGLLESIDGVEDLLCFSSDWPHITTDDPAYIGRVLPAAWQRKVFLENACEFFGWEVPDGPPASARAASVGA